MRLLPMLRDAGHELFGITRDAAKAPTLERAGASAVIVDVFDAKALAARLAAIRPSIVIHQLTDLSHVLEPARVVEAIAANARIRSEGTRSLVAAAREAGVARVIAQSIAWGYATGPLPHDEGDPLDSHATGTRAVTVGGVIALERIVTKTAPIDGIVLRYGRFYGPGTGVDAVPDAPALHVDAAAHAALLAVQYGTTGTFNIADDSEIVATTKAQRELGWRASFRLRG